MTNSTSLHFHPCLERRAATVDVVEAARPHTIEASCQWLQCRGRRGRELAVIIQIVKCSGRSISVVTRQSGSQSGRSRQAASRSVSVFQGREEADEARRRASKRPPGGLRSPGRRPMRPQPPGGRKPVARHLGVFVLRSKRIPLLL